MPKFLITNTSGQTIQPNGSNCAHWTRYQKGVKGFFDDKKMAMEFAEELLEQYPGETFHLAEITDSVKTVTPPVKWFKPDTET